MLAVYSVFACLGCVDPCAKFGMGGVVVGTFEVCAMFPEFAGRGRVEDDWLFDACCTRCGRLCVEGCGGLEVSV